MKAKGLSHDGNERCANAYVRVFNFLQWFVYLCSRENPHKCIMFYMMGRANSVQTLRLQSRQSLPSSSLPISFFSWPRDSFLAPFSHFTTARRNSCKNPDFRTSGEGRGCIVVYRLFVCCSCSILFKLNADQARRKN